MWAFLVYLLLTVLWTLGVQQHRYKQFKSPFFRSAWFWTVEGLVTAIYLLILLLRHAQ
jgi:hypothetical protein